MVFENFTYKFGGECFKQMEGGPIGARLTMSAARLVMMEWAERYNTILADSGMEPELLEVYGDDGRQAGAAFRLGTRYDPTIREMIISEEARKEDIDLKEDRNTRMARVCLPVMNDINNDLVFTVEAPDEFEDKKLPTLDTKMWLEEGLIRHTYFEKKMKTPFLLMKRSAISQHQRCSILANELVRRLSNVDVDHIPHSEVILVVEQFIQQLKNSEYTCKEARTHVVDGIRGWRNKIERRRRENQEFYRLGKNTLHTRVRKKLMEKETWYKTKNKKPEDRPVDWELPEGCKEERKGGKKRKREPDDGKKKRKKVKGVMFIPHTHHSEMAEDFRETENKFEEMTNYRLKMVEKAGVKEVDMLTDNDPWSGQDCQRLTCWLCETKLLTGKLTRHECSKRNFVYETYCMSCEEKDMMSMKEKEGTENTGGKNDSDKASCHLLKHILDRHE